MKRNSFFTFPQITSAHSGYQDQSSQLWTIFEIKSESYDKFIYDMNLLQIYDLKTVFKLLESSVWDQNQD